MKTKLKLIIAIFCLLSIPSVAQEKFTVTGRISGLAEGTKVEMNSPWLDSTNRKATVVNGIFKFSGTIAEPTYVSFFTRPDWEYKNGKLERSYHGFFLEGGQTTITGPTIEEAEVVGGETQKEFAKSGLGIVEEWMYTIAIPYYYWGWFNYDKAKLDSLTPFNRIRVKKRNVVREAYIRSHPDSFVSLYLLDEIAVPGFDPSNPLFSFLSPKMRNTLKGKQLAQKLKMAKKLRIGKIAPEFVQADTSGNMVRLSSFKGKFVLVEFWASWCKPCRAESPNLIKAYSQFKDKNFEIIGVSLDGKRSMWTGAIKKDGLPWINLSDLRFTNNEIAKAWGVSGVPNNFLIDPKGIIIANNLRGDELLVKLREVIK